MKIKTFYIINVTIILTLMILIEKSHSLHSSSLEHSVSIDKLNKKRIITNKFKNDLISNYDNDSERVKNNESHKLPKIEIKNEKELKNTDKTLSKSNIITQNQDQIQFLEKNISSNNLNLQNTNTNTNNNSNNDQILNQLGLENETSFFKTDTIRSILSNDKTIKNISFDLKDNSNSLINENIKELKKMKIFDKYKLSLNPPKELDVLNSIKSIDKDIVLKGLEFAKKISHDINTKRELRTGNKCVCPENVTFCDCDETLITKISEDTPEIREINTNKNVLKNVKTTCVKKDLCNGNNNCDCKCNCLWETIDGNECIFNLVEFDFSEPFCKCPCLLNLPSQNGPEQNITKDFVLDFLKNTNLNSNASIEKINRMNEMVQRQKNISYNKILEYNNSLENEIENDNAVQYSSKRSSNNNIDENEIYADMYSKGLESIKIN